MSGGSIGEWLGEAIRLHGPRVALRTRGETLTFDAWGSRVYRLSHAILSARGDSPEPVAVTASATAALSAITGLFACLVAGKAAVPLDPSSPPHRRRALLRGSGSRLVLGDAGSLAALGGPLDGAVRTIDLERLPAGLPDVDPRAAVSPETPAYVLHTSGSTGTPKGVVFTHRAVLAMAAIHRHANDFTSEDRSLLLGAVSSSQAMAVVFPALLSGGAVYPFDLDREGVDALAGWLTSEGISIYHSVPSLFRTLAPRLSAGALRPPHPPEHGASARPTSPPRLPSRGSRLRLVKLGGDSVRRPDLRLFAERFPDGAVLRIGFASTEAGPVAAVRLSRDEAERLAGEDGGRPLPVGRPYPGVSVRILGEDGAELPPGAAGEIAVGSPALAEGYLDDEERTRARFIPGPRGERGGRTFLTGDLGWLREDGLLVHTGRRDLLVKVRGVRVELGEVESALRSLAGVRDAAVVAAGGPPGEARLVAHIDHGTDPPPAPGELRSRLRERLVEAMVPAAFVLHTSLPRNARGKLDREALEGWKEGAGSPGEGVGPRDELERQMADMWRHALGREVTDVRSDFFDAGGTSLLAVNLFLEIARRTGRTLPLATLVEAPTIEALCRVLRAPAAWSPLVALQPLGEGRPFFCVHGMGGQVLIFRELARRLGEEQPFYGLQRERDESGGSVHHSVPAMARQYLEAIRRVQPRGPYRIGGLSVGAVIAYEIACRLRADGEEVSLLALLEPPSPSPTGTLPDGGLEEGVAGERPDPRRSEEPQVLARRARYSGLLSRSVRSLRFQASALALFEPRERLAYARERSRRLLLRLGGRLKVDPEQEVERLPGTVHRVDPYTRPRYPGRVTLFRAALGGASPRGWELLAEGGLEVCTVPGAHSFIVKEPFVRVLARELRTRLASTRT